MCPPTSDDLSDSNLDFKIATTDGRIEPVAGKVLVSWLDGRY
jgi:hypothetical protein